MYSEAAKFYYKQRVGNSKKAAEQEAAKDAE